MNLKDVEAQARMELAQEDHRFKVDKAKQRIVARRAKWKQWRSDSWGTYPVGLIFGLLTGWGIDLTVLLFQHR